MCTQYVGYVLCGFGMDLMDLDNYVFFRVKVYELWTMMMFSSAWFSMWFGLVFLCLTLTLGFSGTCDWFGVE